MANDIDNFHGHISSPMSRAFIAYIEGKLLLSDVNSLEKGKFFPETEAGLTDSFAPDDAKNNMPPVDGKIASAEWVPAAILDEPGTHWRKTPVESGAGLTITWRYSARHATRRWNYFITKTDWDPNKKLSRAAFEATPFAMVQNSLQPYWSHRDELMPPDPTVHTITLPQRKGYHVILSTWEVADTGNAFYQVLDVDFGS